MIEEADVEHAELIERIRGARRGKLLNLYKVLLNAPDLAATWFEHLNAVRWKTELTGRLREIVIIRVASLNQAEYVLRQHIPLLAEAEGLTVEECAALASWHDSGRFPPHEEAVLSYVDAMTCTVSVDDGTFTALRRYFSERQIVELTVLIGTYNMHTRVISALHVDLEQRATA
jgi:alkylhydroperoxidase family enzyme